MKITVNCRQPTALAENSHHFEVKTTRWTGNPLGVAEFLNRTIDFGNFGCWQSLEIRKGGHAHGWN
jgi:hypothetical protein